MIIRIEMNDNTYKFDSDSGIDISIPVRFDSKQFKAFRAEPAFVEFYNGDDFTVSIESGSGCNCPVFTFAAHLHGTHTECVGHISKQNHILQDTAKIPPYVFGQLITVKTVKADGCNETYDPDFEKNDFVITQKMLQQKITKKCDALIIRTTPNEHDKRTRNYDETPPAFFTNEAMQYILDIGIEHLLVDMPSVDRLNDEGKLSNHHIFWDVEQGSHDVPKPSHKTITEFIYVPERVKDGAYILSINPGNIRSDAAPSMPILYEIEE